MIVETKLLKKKELKVGSDLENYMDMLNNEVDEELHE